MEAKLLYQDEYISITFEEENNLLIDTWNEKSENLSEERFKNLLLKFKEMVEQSNPKYVLTDVSTFMLPMTPELQEWTVNTITVPLSKEKDYSKHGFIMPQEFIANLSIEQFTEETNMNAVITRYFDELKEAKKWLLEENS
ncbi:hypothetical protein Fleli_2053 [Bernardetia litoralis DSM 6794]|uniref:STAS/SEC14 domain-containing protein n=1 Tax=Bernardetia litoralis (strain ATCC 23117 / DSM 6794 / NBRC 15988 / NCIMB 1366 / Fx l1 / Sio-4) TaxID=880071 RepID=I4AKF2_BERLS|nr:hypothetical protein [Bernardetia litoralis]AFM04437.1 hypothetical protein Fleli_2053 [Bernardetia litoralis DSM 6794]